ncbi:hypothetical protein F8388_020323 [Cannabis sativa]|uniref:Uncharacterized protein n=1 Tax=Cannabis sativa TaxID=3483 RepID=A0A7J6H3U1_CANSA|nr:hypothetical protein F8388_013773 [Cannabis sativa]KAF4374802.1 hypothetical protein F8388_020323 [Cannabis sativa]KAF4389942.1 hypothetical protein G4B88_003425 [Cannabis sativa]
MAIKARPKPCCSPRSLFSKFWSSTQHTTPIPALLLLLLSSPFGPSSAPNIDIPGNDVSLGLTQSNYKELYVLYESTKSNAKLPILMKSTKTKAKRKQSTGVILGDDVLNLVIEASVDHSLVMALVTVYGLMQRKM